MSSGTSDLSCWPGEHDDSSSACFEHRGQHAGLAYSPLPCSYLCCTLHLHRLCPNSTGADIRSVCTEAGMYAIRARRKTVTEKDFLDAVQKVGSMHNHPCLRGNFCQSSIEELALFLTTCHFLQVIKGFAKFSATPAYMVRCFTVPIQVDYTMKILSCMRALTSHRFTNTRNEGNLTQLFGL